LFFKHFSVEKEDYENIVSIWEASVRASHDFLSEADIQFFKPLILNEFLPTVDLIGMRDQTERIIGFVGVAKGNIEMLFVHPDFHGKSVGKQLLLYAIKQMGAVSVDVNEQNPKALGFYTYMGFKVISRSEFDGMGKRFPLLHMSLDMK
jgi:putative acetyltransferase